MKVFCLIQHPKPLHLCITINQEKPKTMKKLIITSIFLLFTAFVLNAQTITSTISGYVTDSQTGYAISNHAVYISGDSANGSVNNYWNMVYTDVNGYYSDNVTTVSGTQNVYNVFTADCNGIYLTTSVTNTSPMIADFAICTGGSTLICQSNFYSYPDTINSGTTSTTINFVDNSTGYPISWMWDFGDGSSSNLQNPVHIYQNTGTYNVCLVIATANGCSSTFCNSVLVDVIPNTPCNGAFQYSIVPTGIDFYGYANNSNVTYTWDFGDGSTLTGQNPFHTYSAYGNYNVCLTIATTSGCSFTYCETINYIQVTNNSICGQILAGTNFLDAGEVDLIELDPLTNSYNYVAFTNLDTSGYYCFNNIPVGSYIVIANPSANSVYYNDYLPTYYGDVLYWGDATIINAGIGTNNFGTDINLKTAIWPFAGNGSISGNVIQAGSKILNTGDPLENIEILLLDNSDNPLAATFSDANGHFAFTGLALGTYKIYGEYAGLITTSAIVELSTTNTNAENIQVNVGAGTIVASVEEMLSDYIASVGDIYPNPSIDQFNISMEALISTDISMSVTDMYGKTVFETAYKATIGSNIISINGNSFSPGVYILNIKTNQGLSVNRMMQKIK